ncbi:PREDICTED: probable G-protein coupled receptor 132 [Chinchilla lanigera]|uniref:G-protein coupled receptors family 1 profile domain-containing protein n=1 Tax=Chinchilla lanigera TaxID=34839 RepID=A0A8C2YLN5_CHILA|nr:PREDICTED: probable G-protein coupled receptor 132 [Chinchilla lanigera]XP_013363348.1 PREDICTED: probable G-protein coupled receptor 132 [Chinchilla lanigera]XP_013363349.1 PREDICTED: probable G-protein coupled receptor 132 [Chinchilla lanigera]
MPENTTLVAAPDLAGELCNVSFDDSKVTLLVVYSVVCALGLPANCLTAWLTLLQALQGNTLAIYLFFLALCELFYISTLPLWVIYIRNQHHWTLGPRACRVTAYIFFCNIYVSILLLCCISCDRFAAVVYALESRGRRHQKTAVLISVSIFVLVGLVYSPVFRMEVVKGTCFEPLRMNTSIAGYHYARFAVGFALPLGIIAFTNHRMFRSIKLSGGLTTAQKAKVKHSAIAVVLIFLVCFAPYHVVLLIKAAAFSYYRGDRDAVCAFEASVYTASVVFLCLSTVNSVADPIIYVLVTDNSRQEVARIHQGWKKWSTKIEDPRLTQWKESEEMGSPTALTHNYTFPAPGNPPGPQPAEWGSLYTLEVPTEEL